MRISTSGRSWTGPSGDVAYETSPGEARITLDGQAPVRSLPVEADASTWAEESVQKVVFEVEQGFRGGDLRVRRVHQGLAEDTAEAAEVGAPRNLRTVYDDTVRVP